MMTVTEQSIRCKQKMLQKREKNCSFFIQVTIIINLFITTYVFVEEYIQDRINYSSTFRKEDRYYCKEAR